MRRLRLQDRLLRLVAGAMERLASHIDPQSAEFLDAAEVNRALAAELRARRERARTGGGARAVERHKAQGKLFVRRRTAGWA